MFHNTQHQRLLSSSLFSEVHHGSKEQLYVSFSLYAATLNIVKDLPCSICERFNTQAEMFSTVKNVWIGSRNWDLNDGN